MNVIALNYPRLEKRRSLELCLLRFLFLNDAHEQQKNSLKKEGRKDAAKKILKRRHLIVLRKDGFFLERFASSFQLWDSTFLYREYAETSFISNGTPIYTIADSSSSPIIFPIGMAFSLEGEGIRFLVYFSSIRSFSSYKPSNFSTRFWFLRPVYSWNIVADSFSFTWSSYRLLANYSTIRKFRSSSHGTG